MKTTLYKRLHTQLMLFVSVFTASMQASAHEMHGTAYNTNSSLYIMWHDLIHAIVAFFSQMSFGYISGLAILLVILGYVAAKVKSTEHMTSA